MNKWFFWMAWVVVHIASYVLPTSLAWVWLDAERQAAVASGSPLWASQDTPPILAIVALCFLWTIVLISLNLAAGFVWWHRRKRARSGRLIRPVSPDREPSQA